jgi:glycosyltransferase involved in cell wall biosynthesis
MFSIVIPLYNKAHTIVNTLQSVLEQSFEAFEVIIVDDGSTDDGVQIIQNQFNDRRIRLVQQSNQGVSAARNNGVAAAIHEHIAFLDGDDELLPTYLETMKTAVESYPEAGMYCCAGIIRENDGTEHLRYSNKFKHPFQVIDYFENPYFFSTSSSTIIKKSSFEKTDGFPVGMKINEDIVFFCSLALVATVVYCSVPLSVYVRGVEGQATSVHKTIYTYMIDRTNRVFRIWKKTDRSIKCYLTFTKYDLRNEVLLFLKAKNYEGIHYLITHVDKDLMHYFPALEWRLYKNPPLRLAAICYVYCTKLIWKLGNYPVTTYKKIK